MKKIMHWLLLSCRKATELIEKKLLIKLTFKEKLQLELHKSMCSACTAYEKQSKRMDDLFNKQIRNEGIEIFTTHNEGLKEKIINDITKNG
ncbi:MAG: hypothetical protein ABI237_02825 [Ginsengibacter sp.]